MPSDEPPDELPDEPRQAASASVRPGSGLAARGRPRGAAGRRVPAGRRLGGGRLPAGRRLAGARPRGDRQAGVLAPVVTGLAAVTDSVERLDERLAELARLRSHDAGLVDRLHVELTKSRAGELTQALTPLLVGLVRLVDQMDSLASGDDKTVAGMLRRQLLQLLDTAAAVTPFAPGTGERFDPRLHTGVAAVPTDHLGQDGRVARVRRPGFRRGADALVRPADVEVFRYAAGPAPPAGPS